MLLFSSNAHQLTIVFHGWIDFELVIVGIAVLFHYVSSFVMLIVIIHNSLIPTIEKQVLTSHHKTKRMYSIYRPQSNRKSGILRTYDVGTQTSNQQTPSNIVVVRALHEIETRVFKANTSFSRATDMRYDGVSIGLARSR